MSEKERELAVRVVRLERLVLALVRQQWPNSFPGALPDEDEMRAMVSAAELEAKDWP